MHYIPRALKKKLRLIILIMRTRGLRETSFHLQIEGYEFRAAACSWSRDVQKTAKTRI